MVAPGFLANDEVRRWLNGIEPAWTMLEFNSLNALRQEPSGSNRAIRLEPDLTDAEISGSAVTANALILLQRAAETGVLKLTATGNLSRAVVEEMCGIIQTPDYDKTELLRFQKGSSGRIVESWLRRRWVGEYSGWNSTGLYRHFCSMSHSGV